MGTPWDIFDRNTQHKNKRISDLCVFMSGVRVGSASLAQEHRDNIEHVAKTITLLIEIADWAPSCPHQSDHARANCPKCVAMDELNKE